MKRSLILAVGVLLSFALVVDAQPPQRGNQEGGKKSQRGSQGRGGFGGSQQRGGSQRGAGAMLGGRGVSLEQLLGVEAVQKELDLLEEQVDELKELGDARRGGGGERPDFSKIREMSEEERTEFFQKMRTDSEKRGKEREGKIKDILLPEQWERLQEIRLQLMGVGALLQEEIQKELKISEAQVEKMTKTVEEASSEMMAEMRELFQGGNREGIREKMEDMRKGIENKVLGVLTSQQKKKFEDMKGDPIEIEIPRGGNRRGGQGGQGGRGGQRPGGGDKSGRPSRPGGDEKRPDRDNA